MGVLTLNSVDIWPGQNRWSWTCCSSLTAHGWFHARLKKPPLPQRSGLKCQVRRWLRRPKKGSSRTPLDTSPRELWVPCRSGQGRKPRRIPRGGPVPVWHSVPGSALAPWLDRWSRAHWYSPVAPWRFVSSRSPGPDSVPSIFPSLLLNMWCSLTLSNTFWHTDALRLSPTETPLPPARLSWFWESIQTSAVAIPDIREK